MSALCVNPEAEGDWRRQRLVFRIGTHLVFAFTLGLTNHFCATTIEVDLKMKTKTLVALGTLSMLGVQIPGYATPPPPVPNVNLVYVPVEPCRVADTRISTGGNLVANTPQSFLTYGDAGDLTNQGGNTAGCPHPKEAAGQKPKAALLNITGVGRQV